MPFIAYLNARMMGIAGQQVDIPFIKESSVPDKAMKEFVEDPLGQNRLVSVQPGDAVINDGPGLLLIVDHGEGYLTLYGYNETLLKSPGDWVAPGDVIATVGDSGGQPQAGLYFEIRQGKKPVNPRAWVSRQPKTG